MGLLLLLQVFLLIQEIVLILLLKLIHKKSASIGSYYLESFENSQRKVHFLCKPVAGGNASSCPIVQLGWGATVTWVSKGWSWVDSRCSWSSGWVLFGMWLVFLHKAIPPSWNHTERTCGTTRNSQMIWGDSILLLQYKFLLQPHFQSRYRIFIFSVPRGNPQYNLLICPDFLSNILGTLDLSTVPLELTNLLKSKLIPLTL